MTATQWRLRRPSFLPFLFLPIVMVLLLVPVLPVGWPCGSSTPPTAALPRSGACRRRVSTSVAALPPLLLLMLQPLLGLWVRLLLCVRLL